MSDISRIERGWGGHFICARRCIFRRNTLVTKEPTKIVVSTVGLMMSMNNEDKFEQIGYGRYFETMVFYAEYDGRYWDADVTREISFDSPWSINEIDADDLANDMHEIVVKEIIDKLGKGLL